MDDTIREQMKKVWQNEVLPYLNKPLSESASESASELLSALAKATQAFNDSDKRTDAFNIRTDYNLGGLPVTPTTVAAVEEIVNNQPVPLEEAIPAMQGDNERNNPVYNLMDDGQKLANKAGKNKSALSPLAQRVLDSINQPEQPATPPVVQQPVVQQPVAEQPAPTDDSKAVLDGITFNGVAQGKEAYEDAKKAAWAEESKRRQEEYIQEAERQKKIQEWYGLDEGTKTGLLKAPVLDQNALPYAQKLLELKEMHLHADQYAEQMGLTPDQIRDYASKEATKIRQMAQAAGIKGLEGYGSDVTFYDSADFLSSNNARARVEGLTKYADSSADVYDDAYRRYIVNGYNTRIASALAADRAREYQKERLNYQRDMFHTYGLENGYMNDWATQLLTQMAEENPALARYYTSMHGTPKELLGRAEKLKDNATEHANEMAKKEYAAEQNALLEMIKARNGLLKTGFEYGLRDRNTANSQFRQHGYNMKQEEYKNYLKNQQEIEALNRRLAFIQVGVDKNWFTPDEAKALTANAYGFANIFGVGKGTSGDPTKSRREALNGYSNQLKTTSENLRKRLKEINAQIGWGTATPEQQAQIDDLSQQISAVDAQLAEVTKQYRDLIDQTAPPRFSMDNLEGSYANAQDFVAQAQKAGYSEAQIKEALIKELKANKFTDDVINKITNGLFPSEVSQAVQQGAAALDKR